MSGLPSRLRYAVGALVILGIVGVAVVPALLRARIAAGESGALGELRNVLSAETAYAAANGGYFDRLECLIAPSQCIPGYRGPAFLDRNSLDPGLGYKVVFHPGAAAEPAPDDRSRVSATSVRAYTVTFVVEDENFHGRGFCGDWTGIVAFINRPQESFPRTVSRGMKCIRPGEPETSAVAPPPLLKFARGELKETSVLPTLDTPLPARGSAVWCAALDIAWSRARTEVVKGPLLLAGSPASARRLNASPSSESDVTADSLLAMAGPSADMVVRIPAEMRRRFPQATAPELRSIGFVAFAYMLVNVPFKLLYQEHRADLPFTDGAGRIVPVRAFGIDQGEGLYTDLREQARVLFSDFSRPEAAEFAIDPDAGSAPYQLVVARVRRPVTLAAGVDRVRRLSGSAAPRPLGSDDVLLVPNQHWDVEHVFNDLVGPMLNPGFEGYAMEAKERIRFRLDRTGARLEAEATVTLLGADPRKGTEYVFDRPFLLLLRKRGQERPIFAMWIDNAELLEKTAQR